MNTKCKKCGRPLRDPVSIARGMGAKCAGLAGGGKRYRARLRPSSGAVYPTAGDAQVSKVSSSPVTERPDQASKVFGQFPSDLVNLVLAPPELGSIAAQIKSYSRQRKPNRINSAQLIKQLRSMCIEMRLTFWPGTLHESGTYSLPALRRKGLEDWRERADHEQGRAGDLPASVWDHQPGTPATISVSYDTLGGSK